MLKINILLLQLLKIVFILLLQQMVVKQALKLLIYNYHVGAHVLHVPDHVTYKSY